MPGLPFARGPRSVAGAGGAQGTSQCRIPFMLLLLLACVDAPDATGSPSESGARGDTADTSTDTESGTVDSASTGDSAVGDTSSGETGSSPDTADAFDPAICALPTDVLPLACTLANPGPVDIDTIALIAARLRYLAESPQSVRYAWECSSTTDGVITTLMGDCTDSDGNTWTGSASWAWDGLAEVWSFDGLTKATSEGVTGTWDGTWALLQLDEGYISEAVLTATVAGSIDPDVPDGVFTVSGEVDVINQRFYADAAFAQDGLDYCFAADVSYGYTYVGCDNLYGWWQVQGDRSATLVEVGRNPECDCGCWDPSDEDPTEFCR